MRRHNQSTQSEPEQPRVAQAGPRCLRDTLSITGRSADTERVPRAALSSLPPASSSGRVWAFTSLLCGKLRRPLYKIRGSGCVSQGKPASACLPTLLPKCVVLPRLPVIVCLISPSFPQISTWCLHSAFQWPGPSQSLPPASIPSFYLNFQTFPLSRSYSVLEPT